MNTYKLIYVPVTNGLRRKPRLVWADKKAFPKTLPVFFFFIWTKVASGYCPILGWQYSTPMWSSAVVTHLLQFVMMICFSFPHRYKVIWAFFLTSFISKASNNVIVLLFVFQDNDVCNKSQNIDDCPNTHSDVSCENDLISLSCMNRFLCTVLL